MVPSPCQRPSTPAPAFRAEDNSHKLSELSKDVSFNHIRHEKHESNVFGANQLARHAPRLFQSRRADDGREKRIQALFLACPSAMEEGNNAFSRAR